MFLVKDAKITMMYDDIMLALRKLCISVNKINQLNL